MSKETEEFSILREKLVKRRFDLVEEIRQIDQALGRAGRSPVPRINRRSDSMAGRIAACLREHPDAAANEIAEIIGITPNKVSGVLTGLFKSERVTRVRDHKTPRGVWRWRTIEGILTEGKIA